jgi:ribonucleoside-diphosphate reductase alpha chain
MSSNAQESAPVTELFPETIAAFGGNEQRAKVFLDRYAKKDTDGKPVETHPEQMWERVADAIGADPFQRSQFYDLLEGFKFVPGGRILAGAGVDAEVTYYNCYVIPIETKVRRAQRAGELNDGIDFLDSGCDSREAIFDTIGLMVDIMSRGGGVGINWSVLRPKGGYLKRVNGTSSGPVGWMDVASKAVGEVEQGGSRRGAAMFMLDDWHPDLLTFIDAKRDMSRILNANVSVAVSDQFMDAVLLDEHWTFHFPDTSHPAYNAEWDGDLGKWYGKGYPVIRTDAGPARAIWRKLAEAAHASGEPGVVFLDRYNKVSTANGIERLISVNPCGEQGLGPYSVCNLGAMNLDAYVGSANEWGEQRFNWPAFKRDVRTAIQFLDRVVDLNYYFLPENEKVQKRLRRVGLSVMGLADALIRLGIRYGSKDAIEFTETVFREMKQEAVLESVTLAAKYGFAPAYEDWMVDRPYIANLPDGIKSQVGEFGLRNLFLLTQAPTGTTSILAGVNSGIEPLFDLGYVRKDRTGEHFVRPAVLDKVWPEGTARPEAVVTANEVTVEQHIAMQAAVQRYVDSSVSKTINAPNSQTVEEVEKAYTLAYESGLKGLAYYRDGSRNVQVLNRDKEISEVNKMAADLIIENALLKMEVESLKPKPKPRPGVLHGRTRKVQSKHGSVYVTVNRDDEGEPVEVFFAAGKSGEETMLMAEAMGRLASLALRKGATLGGVANQLEGIGGKTKIAFQKSLPHAIGEALSAENREHEEVERMVDEMMDVEMEIDGEVYRPEQVSITINNTIKPLLQPEPQAATMSQRPSGPPCPDCTAPIVYEEGCQKCHECGWSAC